jgi:undecaprenyl-diphosphatase
MSGWIGLLHRQDERALHFVLGRRFPWLDRLMRRLTHLADPLPAIATAGFLAALPQTATHGQQGLFALVLSHLWVQLLKRSLCRARPVLPVGIESLVHAPDRFSFPSGHAAAGMSVALALVTWLPAPLAALAALGAVVVGVSRSYLGVHYPGDVLAGWLLANFAYLLGGVIL